MRNMKKIFLFLLAVSAVTFGVSATKKPAECKDKNGKVIKCPVKGSNKKEEVKEGSTKKEGKQKEKATSSN